MGIYDAEKGSWFVGKINYMVFAVAADISDFSLIQRYFPVIAPMYAFALQPNDDFMISKMAVRQLLPLPPRLLPPIRTRWCRRCPAA